ncbi:unnamed protein product, partial [Staurois parvus]
MDKQSSGCPHSKLLAVGAPNRREGPGEPVGNPRRGGSKLLCAKPLHTVVKY